jgi:mannose-6-phosphate isomerase-like protein (cupin superfamily)
LTITADQIMVNRVDHLTRRTVMAVIPAPAAPTHELGSTRFTSLATPSRGSTTTSVWQVEIEPGTEATPHSLTREEVFVVLGGTASVRLADVEAIAGTGDAIAVPPDMRFAIEPIGDEPLRMLCCLPVGGQARTDDGALFTPPWAQ